MRRCVGITDCKEWGEPRKKALEERRVELHLVTVGEMSDVKTNFPERNFQGISSMC